MALSICIHTLQVCKCSYILYGMKYCIYRQNYMDALLYISLRPSCSLGYVCIYVPLRCHWQNFLTNSSLLLSVTFLSCPPLSSSTVSSEPKLAWLVVKFTAMCSRLSSLSQCAIAVRPLWRFIKQIWGFRAESGSQYVIHSTSREHPYIKQAPGAPFIDVSLFLGLCPCSQAFPPKMRSNESLMKL